MKNISVFCAASRKLDNRYYEEALAFGEWMGKHNKVLIYEDIMMKQSDVFVALPGGIGTLDEIFTVMASNSIGYHAKKVILFNVSGFWDGLLGVLNEMDSKHFINVPLSQYLEVVRSWDELDRLLG